MYTLGPCTPHEASASWTAGRLSLVVMTGQFDYGIWSGMSVCSNSVMAWGRSNSATNSLCVFHFLYYKDHLEND